jgi:superfamily I DNA/RNA helicase
MTRGVTSARWRQRVRSWRRRVKILSMHSSKGLEFRCVAVPDLGAMPSAKVPLEDEPRLLYVTLTRATEHVLLTNYSARAFTRQCVELQDKALAA